MCLSNIVLDWPDVPLRFKYLEQDEFCLDIENIVFIRQNYLQVLRALFRCVTLIIR